MDINVQTGKVMTVMIPMHGVLHIHQTTYIMLYNIVVTHVMVQPSGYCDLIFMLLISLECVDTDGWMDAHGITCVDWVGFDCSVKYGGYTDEQMHDVLRNCCTSCHKTVGKHIFSFKYSI